MNQTAQNLNTNAGELTISASNTNALNAQLARERLNFQRTAQDRATTTAVSFRSLQSQNLQTVAGAILNAEQLRQSGQIVQSQVDRTNRDNQVRARIACSIFSDFTTHDPAPLDSFTDSTHPVASQNKHVEMADLSRSLHPSSKQAPRASLQTMDTPVTDVAADMEAAVEQIEENMHASSVGRSLGSGSGFLGSLASAIRSQPPPSITEQAFQQTLNLQPGLGEFRSPADRIAQRDRREEIKQ